MEAQPDGKGTHLGRLVTLCGFSSGMEPPSGKKSAPAQNRSWVWITLRCGWETRDSQPDPWEPLPGLHTGCPQKKKKWDKNAGHSSDQVPFFPPQALGSLWPPFPGSDLGKM